MEVRFEVGERERHEVVFSWDQVWGRLSLKVDGVNRIKTIRVVSFSLVKAYEITVGDSEKHQVRVEKRRELVAAGFRPQVITAFVDGQKVAEGVSKLTRPQVRFLIVFGVVVAAAVIAFAIPSFVGAISVFIGVLTSQR